MKVVNDLLTGVIASAVFLGPAKAQAQRPIIPESVRENVRERVDHGYHASIVVGMINPSGTEYFSHGKLALSGEATPDENSVYEIGSISKVFTATLLADMVLRGEVGLDDPVQKYLPTTVTAPTRNGEAIRLAHLTAHTSALPRMPTNFAPADASNPFADYTVEQMYAFLNGYTLTRDIGLQYEYSNYATGLLGHVLGLRAGMSYEDLMVSRIANVLDMPDTRITLTAAMRRRLAKGHTAGGETANWDIPTLAGAGAIRSTAKDMLRFLAANMGISQSALLQAMRMTHETRHKVSDETHVAMGWHIAVAGDREIIWHNGGTGGYRTWAGFARGGTTGVVVLSNTSRSVDDIGFHILNPESPLTPVRVAVAVSPDVLKRYVGAYQLQPGVDVEIRVRDGQLTAQVTGQPELTMYPQSESSFFFKEADIQVSFEASDQHGVTALVVHQGGSQQRAERK